MFSMVSSKEKSECSDSPSQTDSQNPAILPEDSPEEFGACLRIPCTVLQQLKPSEAEKILYEESRIGWERVIPFGNDKFLRITVRHYTERCSQLKIRALLSEDDLSMLSIVVCQGLASGHLTIPGNTSYEIRNVGTDLTFMPLEDRAWSCAEGV